MIYKKSWKILRNQEGDNISNIEYEIKDDSYRNILVIKKNGKITHKFHALWWFPRKYYKVNGEYYLPISYTNKILEVDDRIREIGNKFVDSCGAPHSKRGMRKGWIPKEGNGKRLLDIYNYMNVKSFMIEGWESSRLVKDAHFRRTICHAYSRDICFLILKKKGGVIAYVLAPRYGYKGLDDLELIFKFTELPLSTAIKYIKRRKEEYHTHFEDSIYTYLLNERL